MKRIAILSDIHSNLEALEAALLDAQGQECTEFVCLGDLIGYGPNPRQVLRVAMNMFRFTLRGNHEEGVLYEPVGFNWKAEASAWWTKDQLRSKRFPADENRRFWQYLETMPTFVADKDVLYVHASPLDPTKEYVMPEASYNPQYMKAMFSRVRRVAFGGHTHLPGIFFDNRPFLPQEKIHDPFPVIGGKFFVNVGSVGQPRDGNVRACYAIFDGYYVTFRRVAYDHKKTSRKIQRIKRLPNALGRRLAMGI